MTALVASNRPANGPARVYLNVLICEGNGKEKMHMHFSVRIFPA